MRRREPVARASPPRRTPSRGRRDGRRSPRRARPPRWDSVRRSSPAPPGAAGTRCRTPALPGRGPIAEADGELPVELHVVGRVDDAHAPSPEDVDDDVPSDGRAAREHLQGRAWTPPPDRPAASSRSSLPFVAPAEASVSSTTPRRLLHRFACVKAPRRSAACPASLRRAWWDGMAFKGFVESHGQVLEAARQEPVARLVQGQQGIATSASGQIPSLELLDVSAGSTAMPLPRRESPKLFRILYRDCPASARTSRRTRPTRRHGLRRGLRRGHGQAGGALPPGRLRALRRLQPVTDTTAREARQDRRAIVHRRAGKEALHHAVAVKRGFTSTEPRSSPACRAASTRSTCSPSF